MSNKKISQLDEATNVAFNDLLQVIDVSDSSMSIAGTNKKITAQTFGSNLPVVATGSTTSRSLKDRFADTMNVKDFGAVGDGVTDDTVAIQVALSQACATLKSLRIPSGNYKISQTLVITAPIEIYGDGISKWWTTSNEVAATQLSFVGAGAKTHQNYGVSNMAVSGGVVPNASARSGYNESGYSLLDFMNTNGSVKGFSIGVLINSSGVKISNLRLLPSGGGATHLDFYNNAAATGTEDWSAGNNWDVGILLNGYEDCEINRVQCVGHWRMAGLFISSTGIGATDQRTPYRNYIQNCFFQGYKASAIRGSDKLRIIAKGTGYVDVPYIANHPFVSSVLSTLRWGTGGFSTNSLGATATEVIGAVLRIFCTGDLSSINTSQDEVVVKAFGGGNSHIHFSNCAFKGLEHPSKFVAHRTRVVSNGLSFAYNYPSGCLEMSGHRGTEAIFEKCQFQTFEEDFIHIHDHNHTLMEMCAFEVDLPANGERRGRVITSPSPDKNTRVAYPCGQTYVIKIDGSLYDVSNVDFRPSVPQSLSELDYTGIGDDGLFSANVVSVPFYTNNHAFIRPRKNENAGIANYGFPQSSAKLYYDSLQDRNISVAGFYNANIVQFEKARLWNGASWSDVALQNGREMVLAIPENYVLELQLSSLAASLMLTVAGNSITLPKGIFFCRPRTTEWIQAYGTPIASTDLSTFAGQDFSATSGTAGDLNISAVQKTLSGVATACLQFQNRIVGSTGTYSITIN